MATRLQRLHHRRADGDVGDEVAVHHVHVNQIGAAALDGGDVAPERGEVGGQNRRRDLHGHSAHRLTSSDTASVVVTWNAAGGLLADHGAGRHARIRLRADDGDAQALLAQRVGGALAVGADDVGHHVGQRRPRRG